MNITPNVLVGEKAQVFQGSVAPFLQGNSDALALIVVLRNIHSLWDN